MIVALALALALGGAPRPLPGAAAPALAAAALALAALWLPGRSAGLALGLMALAILWSPQRFVHAAGPIMEPRPTREGEAAVVASLPGVPYRYRVYDEFVLEHRPGSRLGIRDFRGYPSGDPLESRRYRQILDYAASEPLLLGAFNVRYLLVAPHSRNGLRSHHLRTPAERLGHRGQRMGPRRIDLDCAAERVVWYPRAEIAMSAAEALPSLLAEQRRCGERSAAVVESGDATADVRALASAPTGPPRSGRVTAESGRRVIAELWAPAAGIAVLNEAHAPGWIPYVDGRARAPLRVDSLLRGVVVGPGAHTLEWRYRPPRFSLYFGGWLLTWLALASVALAPTLSRAAGRLKSRRPRSRRLRRP